MKRFHRVSLLVGTLIVLPATYAAAQQQEPAAPAPEATPPPADAPSVTPPPPPQASETSGPTTPAKKPTRAKGNEQTEEIVVTGSRIRTNPTDAPMPVMSITAEDIQRSGITSIGDVLQRLPMSGGGINARFNSSGNAGFPPDGSGVGAGSTQADLRYLGPKRVLVLVDGVRWVAGSSASGVPAATDLNTIPMSIVDRVEVLEDGASPVYGSDAISGVINIITKRDFNGFAANAYLGGYSAGDGGTQQYDLSWGNKSEGLTITTNLSFVDQRGISSADRDISKWPVPGVAGCNGRCSSGTSQGRILFDPGQPSEIDLALNAGTATPVYDPANPYTGGTYHQFINSDRFNFQPYNYIMTPSTRFGAFTYLDYKLVDHVSMFAKALYNNRKSANQAAPTPLFVGPEAGNGNRLDTISIDATNPYNPFGFSLDPATVDFVVTRRPLEAGPRIFKQNVDTIYVDGGFKGDFGVATRSFNWDVTAIYSRNRADQIMTGNFNSARLQKALGPVAACNAEPGCVPFNIFGGQGPDGKGTITKEMLDYVMFTQHDLSQQELYDFSANLTGDLVELPGGTMSIAVGAQYREQKGFFEPDAIVVAGDTSDVPASPTSGSFSVTEGYAELLIPLLSNLPGFDLLDASAAARISKYSTFGAENTFKAGVRWRPIPDLLLRGLFVQGFRAPSIGELFGSSARFDQVIKDPCSNVANQSAQIQENCAAMNVPAGYQQLNSQISVTTGGNSELNPETSKTWSAGFVFSPGVLEHTAFSERASLEANYYTIQLDGAIQAINAQVQIDLCARTLDPVLCGGITRTGAGNINGFNNRLTNIGGVTTSGLDLALNYLSPDVGIGRVHLAWMSNFLLEYDEKIPSSDGFTTVSRKGREMGDPSQAFPKFKSTLIADLLAKEFRASWTLRYISAVTETCQDMQDFPGTCSNPDPEADANSTNVLKARVYNDVQFGYTPSQLDDRVTVTIGVNNLFNVAPPACYSCALNGYDPSTYDIPGIFGYVRAGYRM